jgi:hypothetical protein
VATRVGGQQEQIEHRRTGLLVDDPPTCAPSFLADRHFESWAAAIGAALAQAAA